MTYCNNCGYESHCGNDFWKENIEVCKHCRCEKCEISLEDEIKYELNEDLFNGA
jgi:hypothetical protein